MSKMTIEPAAQPPVIVYRLMQVDYDRMMQAAGSARSRWLSRWAFWPLVLVNAGLSAWFLWPVAIGERGFDPSYLGNLCVALALLVGRYCIVPWMRRWSLRQSKLAGRDYEIRFGGDGIEVTAGGLSSRIDRTEISSFTETDAYFFFWLNRFQAVIAPKRAINTPDGETALRSYAAGAKWKKR